MYDFKVTFKPMYDTAIGGTGEIKNDVVVIKAIRALTGQGLLEAINQYKSGSLVVRGEYRQDSSVQDFLSRGATIEDIIPPDGVRELLIKAAIVALQKDDANMARDILNLF